MWIRKRYDEAEGRRKLRFSKPLWGASLLAAAVLALGVNGTLSQFVAQITNDQNHVSTTSFAFSESLVDPETGAPVAPPCQTAGAGESLLCSQINKYGEGGAAATPMAPGDMRSTVVQLKNESQLPAGLAGNLTLDVGTCTNIEDPASATPPGDLCGTLTVTLTCPTLAAPIGPETMTAFTALSPIEIATNVAPQDTVNCTFTVNFPPQAGGTFPPALQNVEVSQDLTWTFTSV